MKVIENVLFGGIQRRLDCDVVAGFRDPLAGIAVQTRRTFTRWAGYGRFQLKTDAEEGRELMKRALAIFEELSATGWIEETEHRPGCRVLARISRMDGHRFLRRAMGDILALPVG